MIRGAVVRIDLADAVDPESAPYARLAAAVISMAARDVMTGGGREEGLGSVPECAKRRKHHRYLSAWRFFFSHQPADVANRTHWFHQAGVVVPEGRQIWDNLKRWAALSDGRTNTSGSLHGSEGRDGWPSASDASTVAE